MELSDITSALSAAAPYEPMLLAFANLGIDITQLIKPGATDYDQQYQDRLKKAADLITALVAARGDDVVPAADALNAFDDELLTATGRPLIGGLSTELVAIRVDRLLAHIADSAELAFYRELFVQINAAKQPGAQQVGVVAAPTVAARA